MKLLTYLILAITTAFSCQSRNHDHYKNLIIGDWLYVGSYTPHEPFKIVKKDPFDLASLNMHLMGYTFKENGFCEKLPGYFYYSPESIGEEFCGKNTKYVLYGDSLKIFNLSINDWNKTKVTNLTDSSLVLQVHDTLTFIYKKNIRPLGKKLSFDKIIVSSDAGFTINDIILSREGEIIYYDESRYGMNGLFTSKISKVDFQSIEDDFNKANIDRLKNSYESTSSEFEEVIVTFIKGGKIYKTVKDDAAQVSKEFYWAYHHITYLNQLLKLEDVNKNTIFPNGIYGIGKNNKMIRLERPEGFYLSSLLMSAEVVKRKFKADFILYYLNDSELGKITTDGRFYKIPSKDRKDIIVDLGYNFIKQNSLEARFTEIQSK